VVEDIESIEPTFEFKVLTSPEDFEETHVGIEDRVSVFSVSSECRAAREDWRRTIRGFYLHHINVITGDATATGN